jgi:hypothetical protein
MIELKKTITKIFISLCLLILLSTGYGALAKVHAQDKSSGAVIHQIDYRKFPQVSFLLEVFDEDGQIIGDLQPVDILVEEDDREPVRIDALERIEPGVQFILAYNLSPVFETKVSEESNRYQALRDHLLFWLESLPENSPDNFSLVTSTGLQEIHRDNPVKFSAAVADYQPDLAGCQPNLNSLLQALDLATDPTLNPLSQRAILYITAQLPANQVNAILGFIERANQQNVPVYVWMAGSPNALTANPAAVQPLVDLAQESGGAFFLYSGAETMPDVDDYLRDKRTFYQIRYTSGLHSSGTHRIRARVDHGDGLFISDSLAIQLQILAPNPILIDPPLLIDRDLKSTGDQDQAMNLLPSSTIIEYMVEFPDGYQRELAAARLFVDDQLIKEITSPPFNAFQLDLAAFDASREIPFYIEVEDVLGLRSQTQEVEILLTVAGKPLSFWEGLKSLKLTPERWVILAVVLVSGTVLTAAIVLVGKRRAFWRNLAKRNRVKKGAQSQLVETNSSEESVAKGGSREVQAMLIPLNERYQPDRKKTVALDDKEWIIGASPTQARLVISQADLEDVHARLSSTQSGEFWLRDMKSIAGTWVNFFPISSKGIRLKHGDIIQFANAMYRFELNTPYASRELTILIYNQNNDS